MTAEPATVVVGADVALRGSSLPLKDLTTIRVRVQPPKNAPENVEATLDKADAYSVKYRTKAIGKHAVTASSPDGKRQATTSFEVVSAAAVSDRAAAALTCLRGLARACR